MAAFATSSPDTLTCPLLVEPSVLKGAVFKNPGVVSLASVIAGVAMLASLETLNCVAPDRVTLVEGP